MFTTAGAIASILAALMMLIVLFVLSNGEPPTPSYLLEKYLEKEANDYVPHGVLIQFTYAFLAGILFTYIYVSIAFTIPSIFLQGSLIMFLSILFFALIYTGLMILVGAKIWIEKFIELETSQKRVIRFLASHITFGLVLGVVFGYLFVLV